MSVECGFRSADGRLDGATKIILSTKGTMDDVSTDMKAFLDYVDGILGEDDFVQEIDREIRDLKSQEKERVAYMTYAMKIQEEREEAQKESRFEDIKNLMKNTGWSIEKAMDALSIPMQEREEYIAMAN